MESRLLHGFAFAAKQNDRHIIVADRTAAALIVMIFAPWVVFRDADRLSAQSADTLRVAAT